MDGAECALAELVPAVVNRLPAILDEVRQLLVEQHSGYAEFISAELDEVLEAAQGFIGRLVGLSDCDPPGAATAPENGLEQALFEEIGRQHRRQGKDITALLAAYRIGAGVAWRHVTEVATHLDIPGSSFPALAAAVFAAVDQLSSASLRGFLHEQSDTVYARERLRGELAELLMSDRSDSAAVRAAADRAGWTLPQQAGVVLVDPDNEVARALLARLDGSCLLLRRPDALVAIVPDPAGPGRRRRLASTLTGAGAVVGTTVAPDRLPASLQMAELAERLRRVRLLDGDPLFVDEHLAALVVHSDDRLLETLRRVHLAPLAVLPAPTRERLTHTLRSWLLHMGNHKAVAGELHVHPQTVRYRLGQLRELFGPALDDPAGRATLLVALAWGPAAVDTPHHATHPQEADADVGGEQESWHIPRSL